MVFSAIFNNISVISWRSVYCWWKQEKTTDLSQVTDKRYRVHLAISRIRTYNVSNQLYLQLLHHQHLFLSNKSTFYHRNYNKPESAEIHSYVIGIHFLQNVFVLKH